MFEDVLTKLYTQRRSFQSCAYLIGRVSSPACRRTPKLKLCCNLTNNVLCFTQGAFFYRTSNCKREHLWYTFKSDCSQSFFASAHSWFVLFVGIALGFETFFFKIPFFFFFFFYWVQWASLSHPIHWPHKLYTCTPPPWLSVKQYLLSLLKVYASEEVWYVFWIFRMQDILWIFDIRIWMTFIFTAMTKICDLLSSADCTDEKWASFVFPFCIILRFCSVLYSSDTV